ncbi:hypothetical protein INT44_000207 [Umbelopsis vinacea]|uniref:Uncharacterized protein n=1 Tax=Umbelopsis vinacea TaxID=44442 RepID=A0A8H7PHK5_9FUNG|nr:hypothetical protein INT44_000207 [Umbelopsis vinacea]
MDINEPFELFYHLMKNERFFIVGLKTFLLPKGKPYSLAARPPHPRPRPRRWRPTVMAVDILPLDNLMDIDEPFELLLLDEELQSLHCRPQEAPFTKRKTIQHPPTISPLFSSAFPAMAPNANGRGHQ